MVNPVVADRDLYLGIDPGQSGGLALLDRKGAVVDVSKMPDTEGDLVEYLREFGPRIYMAALENVHSFPGQGVSSSFKFGVGYGGLRVGLLSHRIPFFTIPPQRWQKEFGCIVKGREGRGTAEKKQQTKARAQELFPSQRITHSTADALLLAEFCRRQMVREKSA